MRNPTVAMYNYVREKSPEQLLSELKLKLRLNEQEEANWDAYVKFVKQGINPIGNSKRRRADVIIPHHSCYRKIQEPEFELVG